MNLATITIASFFASSFVLGIGMPVNFTNAFFTAAVARPFAIAFICDVLILACTNCRAPGSCSMPSMRPRAPGSFAVKARALAASAFA